MDIEIKQEYLGQLVPNTYGTSYNKYATNKMMKPITDMINANLSDDVVVEVYVTSKNKMKMEAASKSVVQFVNALFPKKNVDITSKGYGVKSDVDEQPHTIEYTYKGASNRMDNMIVELCKENITIETKDGVLRVLISLENGIMSEVVNDLKNPKVFATVGACAYVDRCCERCQIWYDGKIIHLYAISEGVTTPIAAVTKSSDSNWTKTAGFFISQEYGWPDADWHGPICGKGRTQIMQEMCNSVFFKAFDFNGSASNCTTTTTTGAAAGTAEGSTSGYKRTAYEAQIEVPLAKLNVVDTHLSYNNQMVNLHTSTEIDDMLEEEKKIGFTHIVDVKEDSNVSFWRNHCDKNIPQPSKINEKGELKRMNAEDGSTLIHNSGPVLTEDVIVGFFEKNTHPTTGEANDVLHIVLLYVDQGLVLPGKRDRGYAPKNSDVSIKDANYSLVEKEIGLPRSNMVVNMVVGIFDDRKREERMKTTSVMSFVLLNKKPELIPGKRIAVPMNALRALVNNQISVHVQDEENTQAKLIRNHDSLLAAVFDSSSFYDIMDKVKHMHIKYKTLLRNNPEANYPSMPDFDNMFECPICMDLVVEAVCCCGNGHIACHSCVTQLNRELCPSCRGRIQITRIPLFDQIVKKQYTKLYNERYELIKRSKPLSWFDDPAFNGKYIYYS